jgi:guanosine-3',5'-bis(diphosphate) 3'-pyrophosphohydrolase
MYDPSILSSPDAPKRLTAWISHDRRDLDERRIERAVALALRAHAPQVRENGDPGISHPVNVARMLARSGSSDAVVVAGILHDVPEDADASLGELRRGFGDRVADIVALLTKPCRGVPPPVMPIAASLAAAGPAVVLAALQVKVFDRIDNLRTLAVLPLARRLRFSRETLEVLCPAVERVHVAGTRSLRELAAGAFAAATR